MDPRKYYPEHQRCGLIQLALCIAYGAITRHAVLHDSRCHASLCVTIDTRHGHWGAEVTRSLRRINCVIQLCQLCRNRYREHSEDCRHLSRSCRYLRLAGISPGDTHSRRV